MKDAKNQVLFAAEQNEMYKTCHRWNLKFVKKKQVENL